jgi:hypothetical protein
VVFIAAHPSPGFAPAAIAACPIIPWNGDVWRCHGRRYPGDNADGSLKTTGRFNRGRDKFPDVEVWPALYTGIAQHIALGERIRHTTARALSALAGQRISRLSVRLSLVLVGCTPDGCLSPAVIGMTTDDLCHPNDYRMTHRLAEAVRARGAEGMLIPSCTRFRGGNLIIFPDLLQPASEIRVVDTEDPDLFVDWDNLA